MVGFVTLVHILFLALRFRFCTSKLPMEREGYAPLTLWRGRLGRIGVQVAVPLEHRQEFQSKGFILSVPTLAAVLLERSHDENVGEVERLLDHFIQSVAFHEDHVFVSRVHIEKKEWKICLKRGR